MTETSCRDSGYIQHIAPHLLFRMPFLMPVATAPGRASSSSSSTRTSAPTTTTSRSSTASPTAGSTRATSRGSSRASSASVVGGITFDEWGIDGARLCVLNALDAIEHGARVHVHTTVESDRSARPDGADGAGRYVVEARDASDRGEACASARASSSTRRARGAPSPRRSAGCPRRASACARQGHPRRARPARRPTTASLSEAIDGRQVFIYPWQNVSVIGTTDDDYYGDLDDVRATSEEVRYLVQGVARVFPSVRQAARHRHVRRRPARRSTRTAPTRTPSRASTRSSTTRSTARPGVYSMIGGKLASYRLFAQELSDLVASKRLRLAARPAPTHTRALPGGDRVPDAVALAHQARGDARRRAPPRLPSRRAGAARPRAHRARRQRDVTSSARASRCSRPRCATSCAKSGVHGGRRRAAHAPRASVPAAACGAPRGAGRSSPRSGGSRRQRGGRWPSRSSCGTPGPASWRSVRRRQGKRRSCSRRCGRPLATAGLRLCRSLVES